jgi:hypothetical protein
MTRIINMIIERKNLFPCEHLLILMSHNYLAMKKLAVDTRRASLSHHNNIVGRAGESESSGGPAFLFDLCRANAEHSVRN